MNKGREEGMLMHNLYYSIGHCIAFARVQIRMLTVLGCIQYKYDRNKDRIWDSLVVSIPMNA